MWPANVLFIGCGNMGGAMLAGWLRGGVAAERFTVYDPFLEAAPEGVELLRELPEGRVFDLLILGVKPQMLDGVAGALTALAGRDTVVLSMLAGVEMASLSLRFPDARGLVRVMPNLSAALGKSPMGVAAMGLDHEARECVMAWLAPLGAPEWVDESLFDAVTALAGSGPAYVYRFIDALAQGGAALGLDPEQSLRLALATVDGAAALASGSDVGPGELARRVSSPGGSTLAGLSVLDAGDALGALVLGTLTAARDRNVELGAMARAAGK
ncbi:pyrroline-5-carboxylate reductase family protein [Novosphingobium sediminicola]|uniref:Pyrroline-5-carboxylate reductase n=1 Tax=Novosphingobium sediminicola TaxID=563162 RepID=A0A7W6G5S4_9SPHN|nr:pyrroline-5-carboxylate reductase [Novosphingobium sediminicola]MBB3955029.1 pyrroline-5-carboxylate reductase [Novosphingobium sediminicola]